MSVALLDINVLIALFDPLHLHHEPAHRWFSRNQRHGWASCPLTLNGCIRILSNPKYPSFRVSPADVVDHLRQLCSDPHHEFWPADSSLIDEALIRAGAIANHQCVTDIYLLALAVRHHGKLATFDGSIALRPVIGATPSNLEVIPAAL
ncbi:MAG: TA system VapC family ribonuclease toxin [Bryobacteraceae bacterium]